MDIKVGQIVYLKGTTPLYDLETREGTITKIGRKYFYVQDNSIEWLVIAFDIEEKRGSKSGYRNCKVYFSLQEIEEEREYNQLFREIERYFRQIPRPKPTLKQLRQIAEILDTELDEQG